MASDALAKKIRDARANAVHEVPKARLCAEVIYSLIHEDGMDGVQKAVDDLKRGFGNNWSPTTAFQFMSGRRGEFAAEAAPREEQERLLFAHLLAKAICDQHALDALQAADGMALAKLRSLAKATRGGVPV